MEIVQKMELGLKASPSLAPSVTSSESRVLSPAASRLAKLPPIAGDHPTTALMQNACAELKDSMGHLLNEAQSVESRIQTAIESLWKRMLELLNHKTKEFDQQLAAERSELAEVRERLSQTLEQEASLVHQNARMSMELAVGEKREKKMEAEVSGLQSRLSLKEEMLSKMEEQMKRQQAKEKTDMEHLQKELNDKSKVLREYQDKLSKMTEKVQKLNKGLASEKASNEHMQKTGTDRVAQQTAENRKLILEISKLKAQLATSSSAAAAAKEELKKLNLQLHSQQQRGQESEASLRQKHQTHIHHLEEKILILDDEIERLKEFYKSEIEDLTAQLQRAQALSSEDYMDARIKFLRHQNQQEKMKLLKDTKK